MEWSKKPFPVLVRGMRPVETPPNEQFNALKKVYQSSLGGFKRPMTACNISGSANWQLGVEGESQNPPGGVVLLHSTRRALNEGDRKAAHSLEPHQSPAAPQAVQSPWTTGLLCIVRFGASVVRIACSAQRQCRAFLHAPLAIGSIFPLRSMHKPQGATTGSFCASPRFLTSTPPPPHFLSTLIELRPQSHPPSPPTSSLIEVETDLQRGPSHPQGTHVTAHISGSPRICALLPKAFPPSSPAGKKIASAAAREAPTSISISRKLPAASSPTPNSSSTRIDAPIFFFWLWLSGRACFPKPPVSKNPSQSPKAFQAPALNPHLRTTDCGRRPFPIHERGRRSAIDLLPGNPSLRSRPSSHLSHTSCIW